jgi:hypothetical protein
MPPIPEEWRDVVGYKGIYRVSNYGRVRSLTRYVKFRRWSGWLTVKGRMLNPTTKTNGYPRMILSKDGNKKVAYVHQLVLEAFVGPCPVGMQCRHFPDRDPTNNKVWNLSWGTPEENSQDKIVHGTSGKGISKLRGEANNLAKLTDDDVREIRRAYAAGEGSQQQIADRYGIYQTTVSVIVRGKAWKHVT